MIPCDIVSHVFPNIIHGGYDDAASLTLFIDPKTGIAHLTGHSGNTIPLDGPMAPANAFKWSAAGKPGWCRIFHPHDIETLTEHLRELLARMATGDPTAHAKIQERLDAENLCEFSYEDWTRDNDPEAHSELY